MKMRILLSLIIVALLSGIASATLIIDHDPGGYTIWGGPVGEKEAQTFTTLADTYYITGFGFKTWNPGGTLDVVQIDLRNYVATLVGFDSGTLLGAKMGQWVGAADGDFLTVTFDSPIPVLPSTQYSMFMSNMAGYAGYYRTAGDTYGGGQNYRVNNPGPPESWGGYGDLAFKVYGDVPEPATIALLGLGALALLRKRS